MSRPTVKTMKRKASNRATRKVKSDFIRWARSHPDYAWTEGMSVYWVHDSFPPAMNGYESGYVYSIARPDLLAGTVFDVHDTGIVERKIQPIRRQQFWKHLHKHCVKMEVSA